MGIPKECLMPDLSVSDKPMLGQLIVQVLIGEPGLSREFKLYRRSFIRLLSKAFYEYELARKALLEWTKDPQDLRYVFLFSNHTETYINAISRLFALLQRIKSEKTSPSLPKDTRRLLESQYDSIKPIRNTIEHTDKAIQKGEINEGNPIMLALNENDDGIIISNLEIKFNEIATILALNSINYFHHWRARFQESAHTLLFRDTYSID